MKIVDAALRWAIRQTSALTRWLYTLQGVPVWRSFDGRVTPLDEMHTRHLRNTVAMLERGAQTNAPIYRFMVQELFRREALRMVEYPRRHGSGPLWDDFSPGAHK